MPAATGPRRLVLFTRVPAAGAVKTRLVPPLSPAEAAALQRAMTEDLVERLGRAYKPGGPAGSPPSLELRLDGPLANGALDLPADGWAVVSQGIGDLGARLARAAHAAREDGIGRLVMIGSDAPLLSVEVIEGAFRALETHDAAVVPAEDGGYVLIGVAVGRIASPPVTTLFQGIPWGTPAVGAATAEAAAQAGLRLRALPSHWDVDRPTDLRRLRRDLDALESPRRPPRTATVLAALGY